MKKEKKGVEATPQAAPMPPKMLRILPPNPQEGRQGGVPPTISLSKEMMEIKSKERINLYKKILKVRKGVKVLEKKGKNKFHNYKYLKEEQVTEHLKDLMDKENLLFLPINASIIRTTKTGEKSVLTTVRVSYSFIDVDSSFEHRGEYEGQGSDTGDKGGYKAITGAIKYILMKTFMIPTGDDPEASDVPMQEEVRTQAQPAPQQAPQPAAPAQQGGSYGKTYGQCKQCGADMVRNPKTQKIFCSDKCWLKEEAAPPQKQASVPEQEQETAPAPPAPVQESLDDVSIEEMPIDENAPPFE